MKNVSYTVGAICSVITQVVTALCISHYFWNRVVPDIVATCEARMKKVKRRQEEE